uniref:Uncharacterized protein n=1 Tax=Rhizophora mucronata TaxID=61149 RepID=A0A2P2QJE7_RHIMU
MIPSDRLQALISSSFGELRAEKEGNIKATGFIIFAGL